MQGQASPGIGAKKKRVSCLKLSQKDKVCPIEGQVSWTVKKIKTDLGGKIDRP